MKLTNDEIATALNAAASAARVTAAAFAPTSAASTVASITAGLLTLGAKMARQGFDPVERITRLVDLGASMAEAKAEIDAQAVAKFGAPGLAGAPVSAAEAWPDEPTANARRSTTPPPGDE